MLSNHYNTTDDEYLLNAMQCSVAFAVVAFRQKRLLRSNRSGTTTRFRARKRIEMIYHELGDVYFRRAYDINQYILSRQRRIAGSVTTDISNIIDLCTICDMDILSCFQLHGINVIRTIIYLPYNVTGQKFDNVHIVQDYRGQRSISRRLNDMESECAESIIRAQS